MRRSGWSGQQERLGVRHSKIEDGEVEPRKHNKQRWLIGSLKVRLDERGNSLF
jgi:hypothetical protein